MLRTMTRAWLGGALCFALACGPTVEVESAEGDSGEGADSDDDSTGTSATSAETGSDPTTTTATSSTTIGPRLDIGTDLRIDGTYLLALAAVIDPQHPFQYIAQTRVSGGTMQLVLQPLSLDVGGTTLPRLPVGEPLAYSNIPIIDGCFDLDMGFVLQTGASNPITGSDLMARIYLSGCFDSSASYCGTVYGTVSEPIVLDLAGSTFAAIEADPQMLPVDFPTAC